MVLSEDILCSKLVYICFESIGCCKLRLQFFSFSRWYKCTSILVTSLSSLRKRFQLSRPMLWCLVLHCACDKCQPLHILYVGAWTKHQVLKSKFLFAHSKVFSCSGHSNVKKFVLCVNFSNDLLEEIIFQESFGAYCFLGGRSTRTPEMLPKIDVKYVWSC